MLDRLEKTEIRDLLGKGWLTHDGMWFYHTCREFGIEKANALNRAAIQSLAPIEMNRMKRILGVTRKPFETIDGILRFMLEGLELTLPDSVSKNFYITPVAENVMHPLIKGCLMHENGACEGEIRFSLRGVRSAFLPDDGGGRAYPCFP